MVCEGALCVAASLDDVFSEASKTEMARRLRVASAVTIGTTGFPWGRFSVLNGLAALLWATAFVALGYLCGEAIETMFGHLRAHFHYPLALVAVCLCALVIALASGKRRRRHCLR